VAAGLVTVLRLNIHESLPLPLPLPASSHVDPEYHRSHNNTYVNKSGRALVNAGFALWSCLSIIISPLRSYKRRPRDGATITHSTVGLQHWCRYSISVFVDDREYLDNAGLLKFRDILPRIRCLQRVWWRSDLEVSSTDLLVAFLLGFENGQDQILPKPRRTGCSKDRIESW